ncbi:MAG: tetratricopeptide repeat protein [Bacteroidetes bacterium]|nr:tetratricopeptide repeat protein [Bacteroidota bacterium]
MTRRLFRFLIIAVPPLLLLPFLLSPRLFAQSSSPSLTDALGRNTEQRAEVAFNMFVVGSMYEFQEDFTKAFTAYEAALGYDDDAEIHAAAARCALALNRSSAAIDHLGQATLRRPDVLQWKRMLGELYLSHGHADSASTVLTDVVRRDSADLPTRILLAEARMKAGAWQAASDLLYPLASNTSVGHEDRLRIGKLYFQKALEQQTDIVRAIAVFDTLHAAFPEDWRPLWFRGAVLFNEGNTDASIESFEQVLELAPDNREAAAILVRALVSRQRYRKAIDILEDLHRRGQADVQLLLMLGEIHALAGDTASARSVWEEGLRRHPDNADLRQRLEQLPAQP